MKTFLQNAFVFCALIVLFYPIIRFNKNAVVSEKENRNLATLPYILKDGRLNKNLFAEYSSYFNDRFGGRQHLIMLNDKLKRLLHANSLIFNDRAIKGKNDWYFYIDKNDGNNLSDFYKTNLLSEAELSIFRSNVKNTANWCSKNGIKYIFLICPNKHSVYSEFYPFSRPGGKTRADQLTEVLSELEVDYIFFRDELLQHKADFDFPLYYETDTHWNTAGAFIAFGLLKNKIQSNFPAIEFPNIQYETKIEYSETAGDILPMLSVKKSHSTRPTMFPAGKSNSDFYDYTKNKGREGVITKGKNSKLPRALIFRDSFFSALEPFTSPLFSDAEYIWKTFSDQDKEYVLNYKPDLMIFEHVERYANGLCFCSD